MEHELQEHRLEWHCQFCAEAVDTSPQLEIHLRSRHDGMVDAVDIPSILDASRRPAQTIPAESCPFCDDFETEIIKANPHLEEGKVKVDPTSFAQHVALHMELLAMFALPITIDDGDDASSNRNADVGSMSKKAKGHNQGSGALSEYNRPGEDGSANDEDETESDISSLVSEPELHKAAFDGLEQQVLDMLDQGYDINSQGLRWGSALGAAVMGNRVNLVARLIQRGADLSSPCGDYESVVQAATNSSNKHIDRMLNEASQKQERGIITTALRQRLEPTISELDSVSAILNALQANTIGFIEGLSEQFMEIKRYMQHNCSDAFMDIETFDWYQQTCDACWTFYEGVDHLCEFMRLIFDLLQVSDQNTIDTETREYICPRLRLIFRSGRQWSLYSTLGQAHDFLKKLLAVNERCVVGILEA